jgi:hypothetical protein
MLNAGSLIFLAVLIIIVRPVAVFLSSLGSELNWRERLFVAWLAPRGIVAAAVASLFALRLVEADYRGAEQLVPIMFLVIVGTVAIYGLTITPLARWLKVADANPQGLLFVGAHPWARQMAEAVKARGFRVLMVDTNWKNLSAARLAGLPTFHASIASDTVVDELDLNGIGRLLAVTPNDEINSLAALHFTEVFDRSEIYQLVSEAAKNSERKRVSAELRGRSLFQEGVTYEYLQERMGNGAVLKATNLTKAFSYKQFQQHHGGRTVPLFLIDESDNLIIYTVDNPPTPKSGQTIISLIDPPDESTRKIAQATVENEPYQPARAAELENLDRIP